MQTCSVIFEPSYDDDSVRGCARVKMNIEKRKVKQVFQKMCISNITEENTGEKLRANVWSKPITPGVMKIFSASCSFPCSMKYLLIFHSEIMSTIFEILRKLKNISNRTIDFTLSDIDSQLAFTMERILPPVFSSL